MKAYSMDLRERVVAACGAGDGIREQIAERFSVSVSWVRDDDDATLVELAEAAGVACAPSVVHRALKRLGITRKRSRGGRPSRTARD